MYCNEGGGEIGQSSIGMLDRGGNYSGGVVGVEV